MDSYDVAVVGCGLAGLSSAKKVAELGGSCILLEKNKKIGEIVRTSALTWQETLDLVGTSYKSVGSWITELSFSHFKSNTEVQIPLKRRRMCTLKYDEFLNEMGTLCKKKGVKIVTDSQVLPDLKTVEDGLELNYLSKNKKQKILSKMAIDASGTISLFGRRMSLVSNSDNMGIGMEYEFEGAELESTSTAEFFTGSDVVPIGYSWCFPVGEDRARVGISSVMNTKQGEFEVESKKIGGGLPIFLEKIINSTKLKDVLRKAKIVKRHSGVYPLGGCVSHPFSKKVLLVGDAACQASALLGEGIRYCAVFGGFAGDAVMDYLKKHDKTAFSKYEKRCSDYSSYSKNQVENLGISTDDFWISFIQKLQTEYKQNGETGATEVIRGEKSAF